MIGTQTRMTQVKRMKRLAGAVNQALTGADLHASGHDGNGYEQALACLAKECQSLLSDPSFGEHVAASRAMSMSRAAEPKTEAEKAQEFMGRPHNFRKAGV